MSVHRPDYPVSLRFILLDGGVWGFRTDGMMVGFHNLRGQRPHPTTTVVRSAYMGTRFRVMRLFTCFPYPDRNSLKHLLVIVFVTDGGTTHCSIITHTLSNRSSTIRENPLTYHFLLGYFRVYTKYYLVVRMVGKVQNTKSPSENLSVF